MAKQHKRINDIQGAVVIDITGGVPEILYKSPGIHLLVVDYDVEGTDEEHPHIDIDPVGDLCSVVESRPDKEENMPKQHWVNPPLRRRRKR